MMFMASGTDLIMIFIGLETMAIAFYILTGLLKPNRRSNEAAVKYFSWGPSRWVAALRPVAALRDVGHDDLRTLPCRRRSRARPVLVLAVILSRGRHRIQDRGRAFHMWAPDVYEGAPTPITAFLSVGSKAASFAMLLRIFVEGLPSMAVDWTMLFYVLSVLTMTVGNIAALTQSNIKRMLAYSSIAHAGYLLMASSPARRGASPRCSFYLMIYALMQMGAFAVVILMRRADAIGRRTEGPERPVRTPADRRRRHAIFMLSLGGSRRRRVHGEVLAVSARHLTPTTSGWPCSACSTAPSRSTTTCASSSSCS